MNLLDSARAVAGASGSEAVDWSAVATAAKGATDPGALDLTRREREGYAADVRAARSRIRDVSGLGFDVPETVEIQNRHHWIDANVSTFRRAFEPLEQGGALPGVARTVNTATTAGTLAFVARRVLGQYDPLLLADADDHRLYFVHPNIASAAESLDADFERFRRWIAFHEVTHAAEFGAAPWLSDHLESGLREGVAALSEGTLQREAFGELMTTMTAVEGYAELLMDRAFDEDYDDLRRKLDERRDEDGPLGGLVRRLLGFHLKREQYERGREFFEAVADARGVEGAGAVWHSPETLPSDAELDDPAMWLARIPE
ncbi:zinc-dependent metalloprotease [Halarchaeum sp. CBA1220]|uniref:zinc-dependent metalloprotease n=1 Tax=Halarchaeum sp. CBA1220 TaxID=1853682 RepID=UPI000F3A84EF|nr:zinc-dependent metalloprotease [Halarchaeum sp. CBA1220]QLC32687.1 zinc-dependent metalloprotease [Halarchaeum sp. CBA1220]